MSMKHLCIMAVWIEAPTAAEATKRIQHAMRKVEGKGRGTAVSMAQDVPRNLDFWYDLSHFQIYPEDLQ